MIFVIVSTVIICTIVPSFGHGNSTSSGSNHWTYQDQAKWSSSYSSCGGKRQSPVPLPNYCTHGGKSVTVKDTKLRLKYQRYEEKLSGDQLFIKNNGHSVQVSLAEADKHVKGHFPKVTLEPSGYVYQFVQFHFHWDQNGTHGSEHSLHGTKEAVEMHLVHFNEKYGNFDTASKEGDGLLVIAILFDNHDDDYEPLKVVTKKLDQIQKEGMETHMRESSVILSHFLPKIDQNFYLYHGSLTTPPCTESVTWVIYPQLLTISKRQLDSFQKLDNKENHHLGNTFRSEQELNGRKVYVSDDEFCG